MQTANGNAAYQKLTAKEQSRLAALEAVIHRSDLQRGLALPLSPAEITVPVPPIGQDPALRALEKSDLDSAAQRS